MRDERESKVKGVLFSLDNSDTCGLRSINFSTLLKQYSVDVCVLAQWPYLWMFKSVYIRAE